MANIIIPKPFGEKDLAFAHLSPRQVVDLGRKICAALQKSLDWDEREMGAGFRQKIETQAEVKRRGEILCRMFRDMREAGGFSFNRAVELLSTGLRQELNGKRFEPPKAEGMYASTAQGEA